MKNDIQQRILADFGDRHAQVERSFTDADISGRVARCILVASKGDLEKVDLYLRMAEQDYRDVIMAGEYDSWDDRKRDLTASFLIDSPKHFWIAEVTSQLLKRGCTLSELNTRDASLGPFEYLSDRYEGYAQFQSEQGTIKIEKKERKWRFESDLCDLKSIGLDRWFVDEQDFIDAVSGYLLQKGRQNQAVVSSPFRAPRSTP